MAPKPRVVRMERDDLAWEKSDEEVESWERSLHKSDLYYGIASLIQKYKPGDAVELHTPIRGGYNVFYRLEYRDGTSAAMKIPCKAVVKFPEEKTKYEVATMRYVAANTTIPVPKIYHYGTAAENPTGLGPFIIMDYIEHDRTLSHALNDPDLEPDDSHVLDANISDQKLEFLYRQMANIVLQLSTLSFPRIGSLVQDEDGFLSISGRPLIQNMNSLVEFAGVVPSLLPSQQYCTSTEWYAAMADMHLAQITFQHNDAVVDEDDARDKYVARQLFRRLASSGQLARGFDSEQQPHREATFRLYSEDLRPSNVLIDKDLRVVGVIDWEFAYAAPASFSSDPPWWLLLKSPEYWPGGYDSWMEVYEPRLNTFLRVLEEEEREKEAQNSSSCTKDTGVPLSQLMRRSWETKTWMINYAARNSWAFDFIFWRYLDGAYFGQNEGEDYQGRLDLLSKEETEAMEALVKIKMEESADRTLIQWDHDGAVAQIAKVMV
ncbi:aminoglycoside 3'-phosphotransferase/choline kinase domain protein [Metarhizium robertsii]|uniref:Protein kinase-like protein n=2 Tax=Metarhizium robertsii TaxID=568076 RepID=E9F4E1_METRA|nr:Protein kinase-like protein [Metarhizium robertsii ARSEF 23]EFY97498.1 Protein kinase-like protein [Metarhizium robertsii ARSEF 23]EXU99686.1 aminoglycoside 3'-phosphotransferase/choline kinase domain protein [Metarhizium robertsii]